MREWGSRIEQWIEADREATTRIHRTNGSAGIYRQLFSHSPHAHSYVWGGQESIGRKVCPYLFPYPLCFLYLLNPFLSSFSSPSFLPFDGCIYMGTKWLPGLLHHHMMHMSSQSWGISTSIQLIGLWKGRTGEEKENRRRREGRWERGDKEKKVRGTKEGESHVIIRMKLCEISTEQSDWISPSTWEVSKIQNTLAGFI